MGTIVAFLLVATLGAQPRETIELQEKRLAQNPDNLPQRGALLRLYSGAAENRQARRRHILWLIEHHPDAPDLGDPVGIIDPEGSPLADPEGYAAAASLWREQASKPDVGPKTIANAVFFFRTSGRATAVALLDPAWRANPADSVLARSRGMLDVLIFLGAIRMERSGQIAAGSERLRRAPEAKQALEEIESSASADLLGKAGQFLVDQMPFVSREIPTMRDRYLDLSEKWLTRARAIDPKNNVVASGLAQVFRTRARANLDPREKAKLLADAFGIEKNEALQASLLVELATAEFEAGDDAGAERDARRLVDFVPKGGENLIHQAATLRGRVALARGDTQAAREWLFASLQLKDSTSLKFGGPRMELAQDLLDLGERDAVLQFLDQLRPVWIYDRGNLDYFARLFKVKGTPNLLEHWRPSGRELVRQNAPAFTLGEWTLDRLAGKVGALLFRDASCKWCTDELPAVERFAKEHDVIVLPVNAGDPATRQYRVETYPTLVVIGSSGQVVAYVAGNTDEPALRAQLERGIAGLPEVPVLPAPKQLTAIVWEPVEGAESYVVEWDYRDGSTWAFDRDGSVRVIPTRETSVTLDLIDAASGRWRVYAVPRGGAPGKTSGWMLFP